MMMTEDCIKFLLENDDYLILTHVRPDGDTLGSASALCRVLRLIGKKAYIFPNVEVTDNFTYMVEPYLADKDYTPCTVISVDVASVNMFALGFSGKVDLSIDHHAQRDLFATLNYCNPKAAACGEIILDLSEILLGKPVDVLTAEYLYIAISTDTGCFQYGNTTSQTHYCVGKLMESGLDIKPLNVKFFRTKSYERLKLESMLYSSLERYHNGEVNVAIITLEMMELSGATENDCDDLASLAGVIKGNHISCTIRQLEENKCKISLRSWEFFDCTKVAALFGGGGHKMASGCTIMKDPLTCRKLLVDAIENELK